MLTNILTLLKIALSWQSFYRSETCFRELVQQVPYVNEGTILLLKSVEKYP